MRVSDRSITAIQEIVTGDKGLTVYRSGPMLVRLFNRFGARDSYGPGFPSRWMYVESKLQGLNGTAALATLLCEVLDPREFLDSELSQEAACEYLNARLRFDAYEIVLVREHPKIRNLKGADVDFTSPFGGSQAEGHQFIDEQLEKCEQKIGDHDYDGAVTNARSLAEAVLRELERELDSTAPPYDGDLPRLYGRVRKLMQLDPSRPDVEGPLKQVLSGLTGIVAGISGVSNKMGDRHVRTYKPDRRHAVLVVNATKTLAKFLLDTQHSRKEPG